MVVHVSSCVPHGDVWQDKPYCKIFITLGEHIITLGEHNIILDEQWSWWYMQVYESGAVFDPMVLDITDEDLEKTVQLGIKRIAAACLALNYPTLASIPHSIVNGYKNVLAVSVETEYTFPLAEKV